MALLEQPRITASKGTNFNLFSPLRVYFFESSTTSRFVQKNNVFKLASASIYYEFPYKALEKMKMQRLRVTLYANDIETFSSIKVERGTSYPFARSFTLSVTATF